MSRRRSNVRQYSAEDQALTAISKEAESRLAAKRAARTEAREIRMKEIERQQKEVEEREKQGGGGSDGPGRTRQSAAATGSRRGSDDSSEGGGDSVSSDRNLKMELRALEEKYKTAMMNSAQLDNEKQSLVYSLELLKDQLEEQAEAHTELQREYKDKHRELELTKRELSAVKLELKGLREQNDYKDRLIAESGLVIVAAENGDFTLERSDEAPSSNGPIGSGGLLLSSEALDLLNKGREGSLGTHSLANSPSASHTTHPASSTSTLPHPPSQSGSEDPHYQGQSHGTEAMGRNADDLDGSSVDGPMPGSPLDAGGSSSGLADEGGMGSGVDAVDALSVQSDGSSHSPDGRPSEIPAKAKEIDVHSGFVGEAQGDESTLVGMLTFSHDHDNICKGEGQERSDEAKGSDNSDPVSLSGHSDLPSVIITECSHSQRVSSVDSDEEHDEFFDAVSTPLPSSETEFVHLVDDVTTGATCTDVATGQVGSGSGNNDSDEDAEIDAENWVVETTKIVGHGVDEKGINEDKDEEVLGNMQTDMQILHEEEHISRDQAEEGIIETGKTEEQEEVKEEEIGSDGNKKDVESVKTEEQEPHKEEQMNTDKTEEPVVNSESEKHREDEKEQASEGEHKEVQDNVMIDEQGAPEEEKIGTSSDKGVVMNTSKKEEDMLGNEAEKKGVETDIADSCEEKDVGEGTEGKGEQDTDALLAQSSEDVKDTSLGDGALVSGISESESSSYENEKLDTLGDIVTDENMDESVRERNVIVDSESCHGDEGQHLKSQNDDDTNDTQNVHASADDLDEAQIKQKADGYDQTVVIESVDEDQAKTATEPQPDELALEQNQADSVQILSEEEEKMRKPEDAGIISPEEKKDEESTELPDVLSPILDSSKKLDHSFSGGEVSEDSEARLDEDEYDFDDIDEVLDDHSPESCKGKGTEQSPDDLESDLKDTTSIGSKDSGLQEGMANKESEANKADTVSFGSRDSGLQESMNSKENEASREDVASVQSGDSEVGGDDSAAEAKGEELEAAGSSEPLDLEAKLDQLASHSGSATKDPSAKDKHPHKKSSRFKKFKNIFHK